MGGPQKATWTAGDGPAADGPRVVCVRNRGQSNIRGATREKYVEKGKKDVFSFSRGKDRRAFAYPLGGGRDRAAAIAALGDRHRRENDACAGCGTGWSTVWKTQLVAACGLLPSLSSLYTLDTYVGA